MGWHSDDEKSLGRDPVIASLSFGAARRFCFKHRLQAEKRESELGPGTLLVMKGPTQHHWLHSLPKSAKVKEPRINLTFRQVRAP
jgi:alkylated DNA repair dioxygenase AlkB